MPKLKWKRTHQMRKEAPPYSVVKFEGPNGVFYNAFREVERHVKVIDLGIRRSFEEAAKLCEDDQK